MLQADSILDKSTSPRFPGFLVLLFFVEMWERYSYYGMRALLIHFMVEKIGLDDKSAYTTYALFVSLAFAGPVLGGIIADKWMGFRNMVIAGGIVITLGHLSMAFADLDRSTTFIGLGLIAVGTGLFKGNITNLLGVCYKNEDSERGRGFTLFYVGINLGSALAVFSVVYIKNTLGWHYGFGLAGVGMLIGLLMFVIFSSVIEGKGLPPRDDLNKILYGINPILFIITVSVGIAFLLSCLITNASAFSAYTLRISVFILLASMAYIISVAENSEQRIKLIALIILTIFFFLFFALEMQLGSLFNLFAKRNVDLNCFGVELSPALSQTINPLSIIVFGLMFSRFANFDGSNTLKHFALGLFALFVSAFIMYIGCENASADSLVSPIYLIVAISFIGLGEVLIAPFINSQATVLAPKRLRGFVMGIIMMSLSCANYVGGTLVAKFMSVSSDHGEVNPFESLVIYKKGFFNIGVFYAFLTAAFIMASVVFLKKIVVKNITPPK